MRPALVIIERPALAEGRLLHIGGEVTQAVRPRPASPGVGHPRLLPDRALDSDKDLGMIPGEHLIDCLARRLRQRLLDAESSAFS
jgi:hypothetical protein